MRLKSIACLVMTGLTATLCAQLSTPQMSLERGQAFDPNPVMQKVRLWQTDAPGSAGSATDDIPTLTVYPAGRLSGQGTLPPAVVIAPGGGYFMVSGGVEGELTAAWLNSLGITAFVLRYRVAPYRYPSEIQDGQRAIRLVRSRSKEFGIDPNKLGMLGFSAGGHLAAITSTVFDSGDTKAADPVERVSSRPDFLILNYAVISFLPGIAGPNNLTVYAGSGKNLLGDAPDIHLVQEMSAETRVTVQTPPTFLYAGSSDRLVPSNNSAAFYLALRRAGVPAELHIFETAGHGLNPNDEALGMWAPLLINWFHGQGIIGPMGNRGIATRPQAAGSASPNATVPSKAPRN